MEKKNNNGVLIGILIGIIVMLLVFVCLFATNTISFNTKDVKNTIEKSNNKEVTKNEDKNQKTVEVTLPSSEKITINKEYEKVFNNEEKIITKTEQYAPTFSERKISNNIELTLSEYLEEINKEYPDDFYSEQGITISNNNFDFDNDGVNEIMLYIRETYLILHYYDNKVYGYVLNGYRTNSNWRIDGTASGNVSAFDSWTVKYSFEKDKLIDTSISGTQRDEKNSTSEEVKMKYYINQKEVTKEEYDKFHEERSKIELINFIKYSDLK